MLHRGGAARYALYEEAFTIYKKANMDAEAMDVLLTNMCSLERAVPICKTSVRFVADLSHISGKFPKFRQNVSREENYDVYDLRRKHNSQTCGTILWSLKKSAK